MAYQDKSKEELILELQSLKQELDYLKILHNESIGNKKPKGTDLIPDEEVVRVNNSRLELAVDAVDMAWWDLDVITGNITFHKRKAEMLGYSPERFHHYKDFTDLVHPDDYEGAMKGQWMPCAIILKDLCQRMKLNIAYKPFLENTSGSMI